MRWWWWGALFGFMVWVGCSLYQGGHAAVIPLSHYREVLLNLSRANVSGLYIRHDVDSSPGRLYRMLALERELGVRSTVCIYPVVARRFARSWLFFDWGALRRYAADGWVVSYHLNAYERAGYDAVRGDRLALRDVAWIERHLGRGVDRFTPHGGFSMRGLDNCDFAGRFANLSGLRLDLPSGFDWYFSDTNGAAIWVPRNVSGSVYLLVHPEWYR